MLIEEIEALSPYEDWKSSFLAEIDAQPSSVAKGDLFVQRVLQTYYGLSEEDAIDATECAGAGDRGADAIYIFPPEEDNIPRALVAQGKYGTAGTGLQVLQEAQKFLYALKAAYNGIQVTTTVNKLIGIQRNNGIIRYLLLTTEQLTLHQLNDLENLKKIAYADFGNSLVIEAINLANIYATLNGIRKPVSLEVSLPCQVVSVTDEIFIGITSIADMYSLLHSYKQQSGTIETIYEHNIRQYLKRRTGSVNDNIYKTLENEPEKFIAYNNGITIICQSAQRNLLGLQLNIPYIVNGCQTTRTLFDLMDSKFSGIDLSQEGNNAIEQYRKAFIAIKVLVVEDIENNMYANYITKFSNKQNAIRGKDFIALEAIYKKLKAEIQKRGYFLETQAGEYEALSKSKQKKYPKPTHVINSFEATLCYAAGVLGKPHLAFGHSSYFAPGGEEFEKAIENLTIDDLYIPWVLARQARILGYTDRSRKSTQFPEEHRIQTRYFFLFLFFRLFKEIVAKMLEKKEFSNQEMYSILRIIMKEAESNTQPNSPFDRLLSLADESMAIFMALAETERWYTDRSAFLKMKESIREDYIIQAITSAKLKLPTLTKQIQQILTSNN